MGEHLAMPNARPMPAVSPGVSELRVKAADGILFFHAFVKITQRTPPLEIELARKRLKELLDA
jgi:phage-related protein